MYFIFLDTNLFVSNFQFNSKKNAKLLKYANRGDIKLCITYTNYREILKKFKDIISPTINSIKSANAEFSKHAGYLLIDKINKPKDYTDQYKKFLDKLIKDNNIEIVAHTNDFSTKIIDKYFNNEKPFDINKPSFQDAIIWETIVDFYKNSFDIEEDRIFFLTNNIKDFAKKGDPQNGESHELFNNLYEETPELVIYRDAEEFFKNEEGELHNYLNETFVLNEEGLDELIHEYVQNNMEIEYEIEYFLSNHEFEAEYFNGWGEDAYSTLDDIVILDSSKDNESGYVDINCNLEFDVDFTITTKNPIYESDDPDDSEFLRDDSGNERIQVNVYIKMLNNDIIQFSIDELQFI